MAYKKTVWVIEIHGYLTFLNECLDQLVPRYPWLADTAAIDDRWDWFDTIKKEPERTQRDFLVDWIVRQELHEMFYFWATNHQRAEVFENYQEIYYQLVSQFNLNTRSLREILIPNLYCYGDIHPGRVWRQHSWLYVECEVTHTTLEQYAISHNATVRHPSKRLY